MVEQEIIGHKNTLSKGHRNFSSTSLFNLQDEEEKQQQHPVHADDDNDERVSQLQSQTGSEANSLEAAHAHVALAEHFYQKGDRAAATEHYTEAHSIFRFHLGDSNEQVAMVLKKLGDFNFEDGLLDAARELYEAALDMEDAHGQCLPQTLNAAGAACLKDDDFRSAMEFHRRALLIQKKSQSSKAGEEGSEQRKYEMYETLVRIGDVYYSERNNLTNIRSNGGVDYTEFIESGFLVKIGMCEDENTQRTLSLAYNLYDPCMH